MTPDCPASMSARSSPPQTSTTSFTASHGLTWYQLVPASVSTSTSPTPHLVPSSADSSAARALTGDWRPGLLSMTSGAVRSSDQLLSQ